MLKIVCPKHQQHERFEIVTSKYMLVYPYAGAKLIIY